MRYHVNPTSGEVNPCKAKINCRFGGEQDHHPTAALARKAYENTQNQVPPPVISLSIPLTPAAQKVIDKLTQADVRPLLVGGCVRDTILGKDSKDVDMELYGSNAQGESLTLQDISRLFKNDKSFRVDETGVSFAVLKVKVGNEDFDLSLPRTEQSTGEGHRDYKLDHDSTMPFTEAASRRDFTINSMAWDPNTGELLDPYGGAADLHAGILRHVSPAFSDDPLRCLRAVNFASRFNLQVAPETLRLCRELAPTYKTLARERVEEEFTKALTKGSHLARGLEVLHDIGWSKEMPPFAKMSREEFSRVGKRLEATPIPLRRAVLARSMQQWDHPDPTKLLTTTGSDQQLVFRTTVFMEASVDGTWGEVVASHRALKKLAPTLSNNELSKALRATGDGASVLKSLPETPFEPVVTGKKMLEKGFAPGPEMGHIINRAQAIQDEEGLQDFAELLERSLKR